MIIYINYRMFIKYTLVYTVHRTMYTIDNNIQCTKCITINIIPLYNI